MSHIFISYAHKDHVFVDRLRDDLKRVGIAYWIDREGLSPGMASWERAIRQAIIECHSVLWIVSPAAYDSPYVRDEISIARMYKRTVYPVWAVGEYWLECVPLGTGEIQYIDGRGDYDAALAIILDAIGKSAPAYAMPDDSAPELTPGKAPRNPYKGLAAFSEADTGDFFGRAALVEKLGTRLMDRLVNGQDRFLAVLGPSGAGKSSVVMAGLVPALKKTHPEWTFLQKMVPGAQPIETLAVALYNTLPEKSLSSIQADLNSLGGRMLHRLAAQVAGEQLFIYIDQFEELFTLTTDENERQQFITLLTQAATEPEGKAVILLSMRADFYGHPMNYPELGRLVEANNLGVLPMSISELRDAIEKPARLPDVGLTFDDGLVAEIIFALRERDKALAGALPLLQFTLERLFAEREDTRLKFATYEAMGGVQGAIGTHCEAVFSRLPQPVQDKLGQVFLPLVSMNEETGAPTRRRAALEAATADPDARVLVDALVRNRLLQTGQEGDDAYLEIAHESLFRSWERLKNWIMEVQEDLILLRQVRNAAAEWAEKGCPDYLLWPQERLKLVYTMQDRLNPELSGDERVFIEPEQERLLRELETLPKDATSHVRRRDIGDRLAVIGDTRPGVGVKDALPDILWLPVEGSGDKYRFEFGEFEVKPFFMAKYQVTYAQYQVFVEADDGFKDDRWWQGMPKRYRLQKLAYQRAKIANAPRDNVTWYQGVAFARWLDHRFQGLEVTHPAGVLRVGDNAAIRLPTEWEWQWAAQGGKLAKAYPWGEWREGYANTGEAGLNRTTGVGMYPHGMAECGALDISGNVWEWCLNRHDSPEHIVVDAAGRGRRGGSFNDASSYAGCAVRNAYYALTRDFYPAFGLRVVCGHVSPI